MITRSYFCAYSTPNNLHVGSFTFTVVSMWPQSGKNIMAAATKMIREYYGYDQFAITALNRV